MDYARIYRKLIADRRGREESLEVWETHHVIPRSLGGGNEKTNLIKLSLQDHLFAHVLLARVHGGGMAVALINMLQFKRYQGRRSRRSYTELKTRARSYLSELFTGREASLESRQKMSAGQLARLSDPEKKAARDEALYSQEAVERAKEGGRNYWKDPERRAAMVGNTRSTGRILSDQHKSRIGKATKAYWERKRLEKELK